jgi:osmotically-inducible protein OsmY
MSIKYQIHEAHDLHAHVHFALSQNPFVRLRDVQFEIHRQDVVLRGAVKTYYQKQMAQESLRRVKGIGAISNELTVVGR